MGIKTLGKILKYISIEMKFIEREQSFRFFFSFLPLISLIVFMFGYSIGFGCIPFLLMGELFPNKYRSILSTIAGSFNLGFMFIVVKTYHYFEDVWT